MIYCIVQIRRCFVGEDYLQNHHDLVQFKSRDEADRYIKKVKALKLGDPSISQSIPDIRRKIINERGEIYGFLDSNEHPHYFALVEMEEARRNEFLKDE